MKPGQVGLDLGELTHLRDALREEQLRVTRLLAQLDRVLGGARAKAESRPAVIVVPPRPSPLDKVRAVRAVTTDLREANGNLSALRVAKLYGVSVSKLADWLGRSKQAVGKTPDADSLQEALGYFERIARLRLVTKDDSEFRKWLRAPHELLDNLPPLELLAKGEWQALADYVEDMLTGAPT